MSAFVSLSKTAYTNNHCFEKADGRSLVKVVVVVPVPVQARPGMDHIAKTL